VTTTPAGLGRVRRLISPHDRAERAQRMLNELEARHAEDVAAILEVRDDACRRMLRQGKNFSEVARVLGLTRSAVAKRFPEFSPKRT
jgi:hypothetical protein